MKRSLVVWAATLLMGALLPTFATAGEPKVENQPPVATATEEFVRGSVPLNVCLDASKSHDPEGKPLTFQWDFGDGSRPAATAKACHEYVNAGLYAASVTVTDDQGLKGYETVVVLVREAPGAVPGT